MSDDGTKEFLNKMIFDTSQPSVWVGGHWKDDFEGFTRYKLSALVNISSEWLYTSLLCCAGIWTGAISVKVMTTLSI